MYVEILRRMNENIVLVSDELYDGIFEVCICRNCLCDCLKMLLMCCGFDGIGMFCNVCGLWWSRY